MAEDLETRALQLISSGVDRPAPLARALQIEPKSLKPVLRQLRRVALIVEENGSLKAVDRP